MKSFVVAVCLLFLLENLVASESCEDSPQCTCTDHTATCEDVTVIPSCISTNITQLIIINSPDLTSLNSLPPNIIQLDITNAGLTSIHGQALGPNIKILHITDCPNVTIVNLYSSSLMLSELRITECQNLDKIENLSQATTLENITITGTNITIIEEQTFAGLYKLKHLDLSSNSRLSVVSMYSFFHLSALETIILSNSNLGTLYSEYFSNSFTKNLYSVSTTGNPLKCLRICEFSEWLGANPAFKNISDLGNCTVDYEDANNPAIYEVSNLTGLQAGCHYTKAGLIIGCTFLFLAVVIIIGFIILSRYNRQCQKYCCECCRREKLENEDDDDVVNVDNGLKMADQQSSEKQKTDYNGANLNTIYIPEDNGTYQTNTDENHTSNVQDIPSASDS